MNYTANALLACGASPVMEHAKERIEEMVLIANALVLNIGTLEPEWVQAMDLSAEKASRRRIPVVLDPVGPGLQGIVRKQSKLCYKKAISPL